MGDTPASAGEATAAAVSFVTTEHFTLQGARSQATSESTGRVSIFLAAVSGGLVALGLMANARLRSFYVEHAPELDAYLLSVPPERRLTIQGLRGGWWQHFLTIAGMTAVIASVLAAAWTRQRRLVGEAVSARDAGPNAE